MRKKLVNVTPYFLDYTGKMDEKNDYCYFGIKGFSDLICKDYIKIINPIFDSTFKTIFNKPKILKSFLNAILYPENKSIKKIDYIKTEFPGAFRKYSIGSIRTDVSCKCKLRNLGEGKSKEIGYKEDVKDEYSNRIDLDIDETEEEDDSLSQKIKEKNNGIIEDLIVDVEMQIGFDEKHTERFIKYISHLDVNIRSKKIWVIALIINDVKESKYNKSAHTNYIKRKLRDYTHLIDYNSHIVLEIDLNYCHKLIRGGGRIKLVNKELGSEGKEWLKLITMSLWCKEIEKGLFVLPNLDKIKFYQEEVKDALIILSHQGPMFRMYIQEEENLKAEMKEFNRLKESEKNHIKIIKEKNEQLKDKDKTIFEQNKQLSQKDKKIAEQSNQLSQKNKQLSQQQQKIKELETKLNSLTNQNI